ncbi:hypothetical protein H7F51_11160 [Novosphingobium flavum]|uniref:UGSC-like domain-containing protein n=1 Tax=Novosphingobium flavum TaxID=1778672 RepID=A0A7X1KM96_9SPHN|nr:hypothetical protein [Novosphingobium flavum]MBC2666075.1 hypothetical protein [Novosphingobium flavum]
MSEPIYEVLWPLGRSAIKEIEAKPRIADLSAATIAHLSHYGFRHDEMIPVIEETMSARFPGIKFVGPAEFGNIHGPKHGKEDLPVLPARLAEHGVDGVITGIGSCGTCTPAVVRASAVAERAGVPSTTIVATSFLKQAAVNARGEGMADLGVSEFPGVILTQSAEELRKNVAETLVPNIIRELTKSIVVEEEADEPEARDVVFKGTFDEVQEFFLENHWSDGLPVTPPTVERVEAFLKYTSRNPGEVLGVIQPANREATIWATAVNGVMSGCRPEYMPILIAIVEAMAEPNFYARDFGATPGLEPMVVVSGPIVKQLGFNYGTAVMRVGRQSNTSIGRFARMFLRNLVGLRFTPDESDKATIGLGMNVAAAENEDAVTEIGWTSFAQDQGFAREDNVVTVQSVMCSTIPIYSAGETAKEHVDRLVEIFGGTCAGWAHTGIKKAKNFPLLLMSPGVAKIIARDGWSKQDVQRYIWENTKIKVSTLYRHAWELGYTSFDLKELHAEGMVSDAYVESEDPERLVPVFVKPEGIGIVLAGDPGRNQSRGYVQNQSHGYPTAKKIDLPANWEALIAKA